MKKFLRKCCRYVFVLSLFVTGSLKAQFVTIPDTHFLAWLNANGYSQCLNGNQLDTLCPNVQNADSIICESQSIHDFTGVQYFRHLSYLDVAGNFLVTGPTLPDSLLYFNCSYNGIDSLAPLPSTLLYLNCLNNYLTALPLPLPQLNTLWCGNNNLKKLPPLPSSLNFLLCFEDSLSALPPLPDSLTNLECPFNQLTYLPPLPRYLSIFDCSYNPYLTEIPNLPDSLSNFLCFYDSGVKCLPPLKKFTGVDGEIGFQGSGIICLPNIIQHKGSIPAIDTMPICSLLNPNDCPIAWNIEGVIYQDENNDCVFDSTEPEIIGVKMNLFEDTTLLQSFILGGEYSFKAGSGTYRVVVDTTDTPFYPTCGGDSTVSLTSLDSMVYNVNFGLQCKPGFDVGAKSVACKFRPQFDTELFIGAGDISNYYNGHCSAGVSGTVTVTIDGPAKYISPAPGALTPTSASADTITWNVADFGNTLFNSSFNVMVKTDSGAVIGTDVCITVSVTPVANDNNPSNNTLTQCIAVIRPFDPNYKEAYPSSIVDSANSWLTYTIQFQNTGTDTAINVLIIDTLDNSFEPSTFEMLSASSRCITQVSYKIVQFNFPNINLPDSAVNEVLSHGYVQYRIQLKSNRSIGSQVQNTAYIYFDSNAPVATNTTTNTVGNVATGATSPPFSEEPGLKIFPNPANDRLFITCSGFTPEWITIYDVSGKEISKQKFEPQINIQPLSAGIYLVEVKGGNETVRSRVIKL